MSSPGPEAAVRPVIPVILFAYNRPEHLRRTLDCLRRERVPMIYAFADGAKTPDMAERVDEVRRILRSVDWCEISVVERSENLGLGRSVLTGVTKVLEQHDAVLVFEDDLFCVEGTYAYLTAALTRYRDDAHVMSVTGWTHPRITPSDVTDQPYFDARAESWSWGTWARAWRGMDADAMTLVARCIDRGIDPSSYGKDLVEMAHSELTQNIWAVRFLYLHILNGGLCLRPPHSLVENLGFDRMATNTMGDGGWTNPPLRPCPPIPTAWPEPREHPGAARLRAAAYPGWSRAGPSLYQRAMRFLARALR